MPLLLVPYNDTMRFGMGYNSYTQTMCIDSAVEALEEDTVTSENPPQKVTYSAKAIERVSDLVDEMNISRAATIQNGMVEVHGISNAFDDALIEDADVSLMISVKVINQTASLRASTPFKPVDSLLAGSPGFTKAFGDSYISGFVRGGFFVVLIPFSCSNPRNKEQLIQRVKQISFSRGTNLDNIAQDIADIGSSDGVQATIPIILTGGGQIDIDMEPCVISSVLMKAMDFPSCVALNPQRTWAILTKYEANRGFNEWSAGQKSSPVDYSDVSRFTSVLFDDYMSYKCLFRKIKHIISHQDLYREVDKPRAIPLEPKTLLSVRDALDGEMDKIATVVNTLAQQPELLIKANYRKSSPKNDLVERIINESLSLTISEEESATRDCDSPPEFADYSPSETSSGFQGIYTPQCSDVDTASLRGRSVLSTSRSETFSDRKLPLLIPPEVWAQLLPERTGPRTNAADMGTKTDTAITRSVKKLQKLEIMAAVCGIHDVTSMMKDMVFPDENSHNFFFAVNKIKELEITVSNGWFTPETTRLSILYKYTDGPMMVCSVDHDDDSAALLKITQKSQNQRVKGVKDSRKYLKLFSVIYGGTIYHKPCDLERFLESADRDNLNSWPCIRFNKDTLGDDHLVSDDIKAVAFYEYTNSPGIQSAVSLGGAGCLLKNQRQLAELVQETTEEDTSHARNKELDRQTIDLHKDIAAPVYTCTFERGNLKVRPSESPFLQFENGVKFFFRNNGIFEVYDAAGVVAWSNEGKFKCESARLLEFSRDGKLRLWNAKGQMYWSPVQGQIRRDGTVVFSSKFPYLQICDSNKQGLWWCA